MTHRSTPLLPILLAAAPLCQAQQPNWIQATPPQSPPSMGAHAMVYDLGRRRAVQFGSSGSFLAGETWEWDSLTWSKVTTPATPGFPFGHAMVYDPSRRRVVLFGGYRNFGPVYSNETWEYDGQNWSKITTNGAPSPRRFPAMAFDHHRNRTVLFGGGVNSIFDDTWEYDGAAKTWTRINTATVPAKRFFFGMAYDSARRRVVMFGGGDNSTYLNDTYEYDGKDWTLRSPSTAPSPRWGHTVAYDSTRQQMLMFGGRRGNSFSTDTWEWDGQEWLQIAPTGVPPVRQAHVMAFDQARSQIVIFGGQSPNGKLADTWLYRSGLISGRFMPVGQGCGPAPVVALAPASGSRPVLGKALTLVTSNLPATTTTALMTIGVKTVNPVNLDPLGMTGCRLYHSLDLLIPFAVQAGSGRFSAPIPNLPASVGVKVYVQAAAGQVASNAGELRIGNQ